MNLVTGMKTVVISLSGSSEAKVAEQQSAFAPFIAHVPTLDAHTLRMFRATVQHYERKLCGGMVAKPQYVNKDHCPALAWAESMEWHGMLPGVTPYCMPWCLLFTWCFKFW